MSKYFHIEDSKVLDWHFKKGNFNDSWFFYVGDIFIGQVFREKRNYFTAVSAKYPVGFPVQGFRSRHIAAEFLLDWRRNAIGEKQ